MLHKPAFFEANAHLLAQYDQLLSAVLLAGGTPLDELTEKKQQLLDRLDPLDAIQTHKFFYEHI